MIQDYLKLEPTLLITNNQLRAKNSAAISIQVPQWSTILTNSPHHTRLFVNLLLNLLRNLQLIGYIETVLKLQLDW
jgi:hypothetical protein